MVNGFIFYNLNRNLLNNYPYIYSVDTEAELDSINGSGLDNTKLSIYVYTDNDAIFRISFFVKWMQLQFKISRIENNDGIYVRYKFGSSSPSGWSKIS